jgi:hypothetical protein
VSQNNSSIAPTLGQQSIAARNHHRKLRRQDIHRHLDQLCEHSDSLAPGHPDRRRLIREIAKWNVEYQAED